ncbi:hypothetical protein HMN09_00552400 [Mycena chlorophos]|uniref:Heme haloperoxidase family profile domain-containing protein n=1 Tax=Mycena chlorophos TaxID=658473 RepID=A0A8H6TAM9_MYCCL|nr:hypothetical protein HMN09_00552400 [Mycena chlorophos]
MHSKFTKLLLVATMQLSCVVANTEKFNPHAWMAPGEGDVRSPCPGLNTLANHGYLNRSGKNLTITDMLNGALEGFNVGWDAIIQAAKFSLLATNAFTTVDLDSMALHNLIEHDASISRADYGIGNNLIFNETLFETLANANPGVDYYNATSAGVVMKERLAYSLATNPNITNTPKEFLIRLRESALYLSVMGNWATGVAPKNFVQIFFREERLPIEEGWVRSNVTITAETMNDMEDIIDDNTDWNYTQRCEDLVLGPDLII